MAYKITGLESGAFKPLFDLSDDELAGRGIVRMTATDPSFPVPRQSNRSPDRRGSALLNHLSHDVANPYRASHAIFVADAKRGEYFDKVPPDLPKSGSVAFAPSTRRG